MSKHFYHSLNGAQHSTEQKFQMLLDNAADAVFIADPQERWVYVNDRATALLQCSREDLLGASIYDIVPSWNFDESRQGFCQLRELRLVRRDGSRVPVEMNAVLLPDGCVYGSCRDITERKRVETELCIAAIAFDSREGMMVTDAKSVIIRVNRSFTRMTGYSTEEVIGQTPAILRSDRQGPEFYQHMRRSLKDSGYWQGEIWNKSKDGRIYAVWLTISAVIDADGTTTHYVGAFHDITTYKEAEAEIHRLAYYDPLTELPNRRLLQDRLEQAIFVSHRSGRHGALMFLDLDNFKSLNDTRGHAIGDKLLVETARRMKACVREGDTVARLGGDEFVLLLEGLGDERQGAVLQADLMGEKILQALSHNYDLAGQEFHCTASIGIVLIDGEGDTAQALLKQADMALYKAKDAGRNCFRFFDPAMQVALDRHMALKADLRLAMARGQLQLHYQPQVDDAKRLIGAEALLRWKHPSRGWVSPAEFIPVAEETDLILSIGRWVLETACAQIKAWSINPTMSQLTLAVNVSARQFRQPDFVASVEQTLAQTGADPRCMKVELTESMVLDDVSGAFQKMHSLKALGIGISLDDFGTGYSSLSYLTRLPLDQLKIDHSFVANLPDNRNDAIVAQTIIAMAQGLGLKVIAEGVETQEQRGFLASNGCLAYQGYLFGRPLPIEAFDASANQFFNRGRGAEGVHVGLCTV